MVNKVGVRIAVDGVIGPNTLAAVNSLDPVMFIQYFVEESQDAYVALTKRKPRYLVFLAGWINRTQELFRLLLKRS